ncbi:MAG TPA: response regulator, partial [Candidatus Polarisedimenticolaceae bacterium]|nr:response regulator [Candidatus Polarisedimenticolaceae bacterium]
APQVATMGEAEKVNILLVDDQPGKLLAYEAMLDELGENLIKASSGKEALEQLLRHEVPIVLMDVSMPDLDGFELAEIIRQHPRYQKTAIIFVSAVHLTDLDRLKGYQSGAVDYVSVPVIPELLRAKVRVFAELHRKTRETEKLNRELEARVAERTQKQLELTEELKRADRRKDEFLAFLGHELRNPLAPILNAASVMRMKAGDDPDLKWCREVIERQARQLTRLVDDLLDVSRITRGAITLRSERVDVARMVGNAIESCRPLIDKHRHHLEVRLPDDPRFVQGDPARLQQIVANLLNNATKYQEDGGRIDLNVDDDGDELTISVRDRGIGIEADVLPTVFDLFSHGGRALHQFDEGLGIGLSLVKNLIELHGGSVEARSEGAGKGSEFVVRLPRLKEAATSALPPDRAEPKRLGGAPQRILVIDDNRDAAESLAMLLRMGGHEVSVAHDGSVGLEMALSQRPAILFLDIGLPGLDGYEVCRLARARGLTQARIIALSGYGQDADRQRSQAAGFDGHSVKPVELDELSRLLNAPARQ